MPTLWGEERARLDLARHAGDPLQFAGVRLVTLGDGLERGIRALEFRTGAGLRFTALVDRAMDIADCEWRGAPIGWHSPAGFRHPGLHDYEGEGGLAWLRSFSGLVMTCGLDHILFMDDDPAERFHYAPREKVSSSIHGRIATIPARLTGYGERWEGDTCVLWAEGEVRQAAVFGEHLVLVRRIEADVGGREIRLLDRVENRAFYRTPHMLCYHVNVGHPVLAGGARYLAPIRAVEWAGHAGALRDQGVGYRVMGPPADAFHEQVWEHDMAADAEGRVPVALVNDGFDGGRGLGLLVETRKDQLPCQFQWQNLQAGSYALGIEPATNHVLGKPFARERGELIELDHGGSRSYETRFEVLPDAEVIAVAEARIAAIRAQPEEDYPEPTGEWAAIGGRR